MGFLEIKHGAMEGGVGERDNQELHSTKWV